jgi:hypothetical protein
MFFTFDSSDEEYIGELRYIQDEFSLLYEPFCKNIGVSIMCGAYTSLDTVCETGRVMHVSGYNSKATWIKRNMDIPSSTKGVLIANFNTPPMKGTGIDYDRSWSTFYDEQKGYICLGDYHTKAHDYCVEFASNVVAVLRNRQLVAIWAKIVES